MNAVELAGNRYEVRIMPTLEHRGFTEHHPAKIIWLREWDSEVFLHECLHVAFAVSTPDGWWGPDFNGNRRISMDEQEQFIQHVSRFLDAVGFKAIHSARREVESR